MENILPRREARENAFLLAFSQTFGDVPLAEALTNHAENDEEHPVDGFSKHLLNAYYDHSAEVDDEIHAVLMRCFGEAVQILEDNRTLLDEIAGYLLIKETITGAEMMSFIHNEPLNAEEPTSAAQPNDTPAAEEPSAVPGNETHSSVNDAPAETPQEPPADSAPPAAPGEDETSELPPG